MILEIALGIVSVLLFVSLYYNYKFATQILVMVKSIEECLDILDEKYGSISKILDVPLFYDSPQIRQVVEDIKKSRDSILEVANKIAKIEDENLDES
ncbi:MAG: hypothetical protein CBC29_05790 [Methylococcaceae bacterium TMED69]|nr:MAG: hypothetical protein CBC29_05790 [Methylococcaceae bacterium TMED69]|tara:strand:+ start:1119 stop:1409 length:291 start_codon:yes stop_codon:yes gene_type:complete